MAALKIAIPVLCILDRCALDGNMLKLPEQLDRPDYVAVNKIIEAAGGKWNRKAAAHVFDGPAIQAIEPILLTGEVTRCKQDFGQFDTPAHIVDRLIELAQIKPGMDVLEPSAGIGNIVAGISKAGGRAHAFEIDDKRRATLEASGLMSGWPVAKGDFLSFEATERVFDRVVMNPPFANQADIDHVQHAAKFVKRGGRLVSVMSPSFTFRDNKKSVAFREWLDRFDDLMIEHLPENSFKESGTSVNTVIVSFDVA